MLFSLLKKNIINKSHFCVIEIEVPSEQNFGCPFEHTSLTSTCTCRKGELVHSLKVIKITFLHVFFISSVFCSDIDLLLT